MLTANIVDKADLNKSWTRKILLYLKHTIFFNQESQVHVTIKFILPLIFKHYTKKYFILLLKYYFILFYCIIILWT